MRVWFDADNAPHALVMKPIAEELIRAGHEVVFTARDRSSTCELLDLYGFSYTKVGGRFSGGAIGRVVGTLFRSIQLAAAIRKRRPDVSFGHGSRALPIASRILQIPTVTMYDYEWVNPSIFNRFCRRILLPEAIDPDRCREAGIAVERVVRFPGFKEDLYLGDVEPDPAISEALGLKPEKIHLLLRPPATTAHYHNPESEAILDALLRRLLNTADLQLVWLARTPDQNELVAGSHPAEVIIPDRVFPGPQLILECDMVIGGGGTMTREAAILGVPSYSFFMGRQGRVDSLLETEGRLGILRTPADTEGLEIVKRSAPAPSKARSPLPTISATILAAAQRD